MTMKHSQELQYPGRGWLSPMNGGEIASAARDGAVEHCFEKTFVARTVFHTVVVMLFANAAVAGAMPSHDMKPEQLTTPVAAVTTPRDSARVFISGHSLTDQPIPDHLAAIAQSLGTPLQWNRQYVVGSSIATRTRGSDPGAGSWAGYRSGYNRSGEGLDVITELRHPKTIPAHRYDALIITEQHHLLESLMWNDTVRYLRHYHERLIEGNPQATTYFYEPWISLNDKNDPKRWIAYERAATSIWQCVATRINISLSAEGRTDRIASLPAGAAVAELIDRATQPAGVLGITGGSTRETVDSIVKDTVHLTDLGSYYAALVTYAAVYRRSPAGAWHPQGVSREQAESLQHVAWDFVSNYTRTNTPLTLEQCRATLRTSFIGVYWGYVRDTYWLKELNSVQADLRWARYLLKWQWLMRRDSVDNPFYFDSSGDRSYWLPAP